ncbi:RRP15-like protein isoform X3 [Eriocheir sinensis]|uniref:RRP15-like protein isoform X3 n=1 Tax=Eriocheir sinensis TaxID=95602 RepID=UPI0021C91F90|nr:RRP15-like protein isoform X3 [Eriocheir sinensis]
MGSCSAFGCKNKCNNISRSRGISFHKFPHRIKFKSKFKQWVRNLRWKNWTPLTSSVICSEHFTPECFDRTGQTVRLREFAVPTKFSFPEGHEGLYKKRNDLWHPYKARVRSSQHQDSSTVSTVCTQTRNSSLENYSGNSSVQLSKTKTYGMAISSKHGVKRPKVVEEPESSDSEDDQPEDDFEVEIKREEDDCLDSSNLEGDSFMAYPDDEDSVEIKEEDLDEVDIKEEVVEAWEAEGSAEETKTKETERKGTKKVKFSEPEPESDNSDFSESDNEEDNFADDDSEKEEGEVKKSVGSGLANVMAKILGTKKSEDVILSKAKTDKAVKKTRKLDKEDTFEIVDGSGQVKKEPTVEIKEEEEDRKPDISLHDREIHRKLWEEKFRKRPSITEDKEKERRLRVLATQGVVQLFSAIEKHRNMMQVKLSQCRSIMGREKVLEGTGKEAFLDILKQQGKRVKEQTEPALKKVKKEENGDSMKEEVKDELLDLQPPEKKKPKWNVLSDNFYKEPTLHGWDQQSDDGDD